ncbi:ATP-binding cassette domain-containing protein, partial [Geminicoccus harenae]
MAVAADALKVVNATKAYGATVALAGMSFTVAAGEVHALLGENGAGKSTTVKMLSGFIQPDEGGLELFGQPVRLARPQDAQRLGVQTAYQEMTLVRDLTVTDNMLMPNAPTGFLGQLRRREGERLVAAHLDSLGLSDIDPHAEIRELELPVRQKIEIARAVFRKPRILLLDEPTSSLSGRDIDWLGELIRTVTSDGVTVVFISHRMPEVRLFCDRLTVLRNGKEVGTAPVDQVSDDEVVRMIIGRSLAA